LDAGPPSLERRKSRRPLILIGLVALLVIVAISMTVFKRSVVYYLSPTELIAQNSAQNGQSVRVSGTVVNGTIKSIPERGAVLFSVTDGKTTVPIDYTGPAPDTLKDGAEAVAEGSLGTDGVFRANKVFAKCPSKFEGKSTASTAKG
jgi:cytochrome c-type biogenesis protein CcmE